MFQVGRQEVVLSGDGIVDTLCFLRVPTLKCGKEGFVARLGPPLDVLAVQANGRVAVLLEAEREAEARHGVLEDGVDLVAPQLLAFLGEEKGFGVVCGVAKLAEKARL